MPLQPNLIERQLIKRGIIPGLLVDLGVSTFKQEVLIAAIETGLFDHLQDKPGSVEDLARRTGAAVEGVGNLLRALEPLGYVEKEGSADRYRLSAAAERGLPEGDMQVMLPFFKDQIQHMALKAAVGVKHAPEGGVYGWERVKSGKRGRAYQEAMRWLASDIVPEVVKRVNLPRGAARMLDVGGSHGLYTVAFCDKHEGLQGTVIDWDIGLDSARRTLKERPDMVQRIDLMEVDFEREELPGGYDFAFLGQIVHGVSVEGNQKLLAALARATTDNGAVAILDQFADPPKSKVPLPDPGASNFGQGVAALLGFNLFLFSGGRSYAYDDVASWLRAAGFTEVSHIPLPKSPGYSVIVGGKA